MIPGCSATPFLAHLQKNRRFRRKKPTKLSSRRCLREKRENKQKIPVFARRNAFHRVSAAGGVAGGREGLKLSPEEWSHGGYRPIFAGRRRARSSASRALRRLVRPGRLSPAFRLLVAAGGAGEAARGRASRWHGPPARAWRLALRRDQSGPCATPAAARIAGQAAFIVKRSLSLPCFLSPSPFSRTGESRAVVGRAHPPLDLSPSRSVRGPLVFIFEEKGRGPVVRLRVGVAACGSAVFAGRLLHTTCCAGASSAPPHGVRRSHARLVSQDVVLPTDSISPPSLALHDCGGPRG